MPDAPDPKLLEAARKQRVVDALFGQIDTLNAHTDSLLSGELPSLAPHRKVYDALELFDAVLPPVEGFLAEGVLCRQSLAIIAGRRGVGKTFLLLKLAASVAVGNTFGPYATRTGKVLLLSEEMVDAEVQQRLKQLFTREMVEQFNSAVKIACRTGVKIDTEDGIRELGQFVSAYSPDLLLIDALSDIKGHIKEVDNDEMGAGARGIRDIVAGPGNCAVLIAHHMGRPKEDGSTHPRGASALEDAAADIIHLGRNRGGDGYTGHFEKVRHMSPPGDFGYAIRGSGLVEAGQPTVTIDIYSSNEASDEASEIKRVTEWLAGKGSDAGLKEVMDKMGWTKSSAMHHLGQAQKLGMLERHKLMNEYVWCTPSDVKPSSDVPF